MRTFSAALQDAIASTSGIKPDIRFTIYKNRVFWDSDDRDNAPSYASTSGSISATPLAEDLGYSSGSSPGLYTAVSYASEIDILVDGSATPRTITSGSGSRDWSKPGLSLPYVFHYNGTEIKRTALDLGAITSGSAPFTTGTEIVATTSNKGSLHALSNTEVIHVYIKDGGVGVTYYYLDGTWQSDEFPGRFMFRTEVYDDSLDSILYETVYSAAVSRSDGIYVYVHDYNGSVRGVWRQTNDVWSDTFEAIPSDLSDFAPTNAYVTDDDRIILVGQFERTADFATGTAHNLAVWSDDGKTFSLDRFTMFSVTGKRYFLTSDGTDIIFGSTNRFVEDTPPWYFAQENCEQLVVTSGSVKGLSGNSDEWEVQLAAGGEEFYDNEFAIKGNRVLLELGYAVTSGSTAYLSYDTCIIARKSKGWADGKRHTVLGIVNEGLWRTQNFTHPFYMELNSKQSIYDPINDLSNLYRVGQDSNCFSIPFMCDLSNEADQPVTHAEIAGGGTQETWSVDLLDKDITEYPVLDSLPYVAELYGWSRAGMWDLNPNVADSTNPASVNATMTLLLLVEHDDGTQEEIEISDLASTHDHFPQTYFSGGPTAGDLPITYNITETGNLVSGDKVVKVGIKSTNPNGAGNLVVIMPSRIEIPTLPMCVSPPVFEVDEEEDKPDSGTENMVPPGMPSFEEALNGFYPFPDGNFQNILYQEYQVAFTWNKIEDDPDNKIWPALHFDPDSDSIDEITIEVIDGGSTVQSIYWQASFSVYASSNSSFSYIGDNLWTNSNHSGPLSDYKLCLHLTAPTGVATYDLVVRVVEINGVPYTYSGETRTEEPTVVDDAGNVVEPQQLKLNKRGKPEIYFSAKPYKAYNFQVWGTYTRTGSSNAYAGLIGHGVDDQNYTVARWNDIAIEIVKVRGGTQTVLASAAVALDDDERILFEYVDGVFTIRRIVTGEWGLPLLTYEWTTTDGSLITSEDLCHVGIYSYIYAGGGIRTTSYNQGLSNGVMPILPGHSDGAYSALPSSGTVELDGVRYTYTGKTSEIANIRGPYQLRNAGSGYSYANPDDGAYYTGNGIQFYLFEWLNNNSNRANYDAYKIGSNVCYSFNIEDVDYKVWITTAGEIVWLRNRMQVFSSSIVDPAMGTGDKIWVTHALTGVEQVDGGESWHAEGAFIMLVTDDGTDEEEIIIREFSASNGYSDVTVEDMLDHVVRIAGGCTRFPGDTLRTSFDLTSTEQPV